jgi:2-keto-4-pentenoate hydratase/2-oxohepta-3-ene-1,7-dioic acid hydratase in catechol pathway
MKIVTFQRRDTTEGADEGYRIGAFIAGDKILDLTSLVSNGSLTAAELLRCFDLDGGFVEKAKSAIVANEASVFETLNRQAVKICAPVPRPGKIICVGLNYRDHAEESGAAIPKSPIIFSKFSTCTAAANEPIVIPKGSSQVDYEAELAVVIGRKTKNINRENWSEYVFGYTNFNDVSARDFQFADGQWQRGKSCDTFAPVGEFIATANEIEDPHNLNIQFRLNGEVLQNSSTRELIFKIPKLIEFLSETITLEPGDIIATGTPPGVGFARKPPIFLKDGDTAEVEIENLGVLTNPVLTE